MRGAILGRTAPVFVAAAALATVSCFESTGPAPGFPSRIVPLSGHEQDGAVGTTLPQPVVIRVTDSDGVPVRNVRTTWFVEDEGASVSPPNSNTDADGTTQAIWTLGNAPGEQRLGITIPGVSPVFITAIALEE